MLEKYSSRILPLLKKGNKVIIKEFEGHPEVEGEVCFINEKDEVLGIIGKSKGDENPAFYSEIYEQQIDELIKIVN